MCQLLLKEVGSVIPRWLDLIGLLSNLPIAHRQEALEHLMSQVEELTQNPDLTDLRTGIRRELHHHRSYPDTPWAMSAHELELLDVIYEKLIPTNIIDDVSWLFDYNPCLPEVSFGDFEEYEKEIVTARKEAIQKIYLLGGKQAILDLFECSWKT